MNGCTLFVGWGSYFSIRSGEIKKLNVVTAPGEDPPEVLSRDGIPCKRVGLNRERQYVVYAGLLALDDIRTLVQLVQEMESDHVPQDASSETRTQ